MKNLSAFKLAMLSMLVPAGFAFNGFISFQFPYLFIGYTMIFVGGYCFGSLLRKERK